MNLIKSIIGVSILFVLIPFIFHLFLFVIGVDIELIETLYISTLSLLIILTERGLSKEAKIG